MIWQDIVIMGVNCVFIFSLINQVVSGTKTKISSISIYTSLPTALGLFVMGGTFFTIGLYLSSIFVGFSGILWMILFYQRILYTKKELTS